MIVDMVMISAGPAKGESPFQIPVRIHTFERALSCGGSFLKLFSISTDPNGMEGRDILMTLLEPLFDGRKVSWGGFMGGINTYVQGRLYKERYERLDEDSKKFLDQVTAHWKKGQQIL
jgi:hypothetical protein